MTRVVATSARQVRAGYYRGRRRWSGAHGAARGGGQGTGRCSGFSSRLVDLTGKPMADGSGPCLRVQPQRACSRVPVRSTRSARASQKACTVVLPSLISATTRSPLMADILRDCCHEISRGGPFSYFSIDFWMTKHWSFKTQFSV